MLSWEELKKKVKECPSNEKFNARVSTIPNDQAIFITEKKSGFLGFGSKNITYRVTPNSMSSINPDYLDLLAQCRLRNDPLERVGRGAGLVLNQTGKAIGSGIAGVGSGLGTSGMLVLGGLAVAIFATK